MPDGHNPKPFNLLLTTVQLSRHIDKGGGLFVVKVVDDGITPIQSDGKTVTSSKPTFEEITSKCSGPMRKILRGYKHVFDEVKTAPPPRENTMQHVIPLVPEAKPFFRPMKRYSPAEVKAIEDLVTDLLSKGLIEPSSSPWGASMVLAVKKDGTMRPCIDFRRLNNFTVRDKFPLPLMDQLFDSLSGAQHFSSIDLQSGYHQLAIHADDRPKTAFRTPSGHYQYKVLAQGLTNAPSVFMRAMNKIFKEQLGKTVLVYLDDILIFSKTAEEHVQAVLKILQDNQILC
jgi:hypothetical protein